MIDSIKIYKGRTNSVPFTFLHLLGDDVYTSQIRAGQSFNTLLIATFTVVKTGPSTLTLSLDDSVTSLINATAGWMDIKRVSGGEPIPVLDAPIQVIFLPQITA